MRERELDLRISELELLQLIRACNAMADKQANDLNLPGAKKYDDLSGKLVRRMDVLANTGK